MSLAGATEAGPAARLHHWTVTRPKWSRRLLAFALGVLAVPALAPWYLVFLLIPAFGGLLWLAKAAPTGRSALAIGWWWGGGFFAAGLYWVSFALLVQADKFGWLIPIAIGGFALGFGLFPALAAWAVKKAPGGLMAGALVLAATWTLLEWVRGWIFTGFPWNLIGSAWGLSDATLQPAAWIGTYGLSLLTVLAAAAPAVLVSQNRSAKAFAALSLIVPGLLWGAGSLRLVGASDATVPDVRLRLVQPNIPQSLKWQPDLREAHMMAQLDLGDAAPINPEDPLPTHILWGETQAPFFIGGHVPWRQLVGSRTPPGGLTILGAPRIVSRGKDTLQVANSLLAIDTAGDIKAIYDKFHLVPFGEYVPLNDWLPLERITQGQGAFTPGPGLVTLDLKGLPPVGPLICYEIIFPGQVAKLENRPGWLLNLTNDSWYGKSLGPHQHFATARLRAVEEGLPVVRIANTGISGIVDAYGRVRQRLDLGVPGFIDGDLPAALPEPPLYARKGNIIPLTFAGLILLFGVGIGMIFKD